MIPGVSGRLLTASFIRDVLPGMAGGTTPPRDWGRRIADRSHRIESTLGAASSVRAIADVALLPFAELLGLRLVRRDDAANTVRLELAAGEQSRLIGVTAGWGESLDRAWRASVVAAIEADARWCLSCNGQVLRLVDAKHTWSRDYLEFDLLVLGGDAGAQAVLWATAHRDALSGQPSRLDTAVNLSRQHGVHVCRALGAGVLDALAVLLNELTRRRTQPASNLWEQSLTVLYRILFLLFAEARGLVPLWHPIYRDRYSLESIVTGLLQGRPCKGLWRTINAISRLAHAGCTAGELRVTAFNGRLFAPAQAVVFDRTPMSDPVMSSAIIAVSSTPSGHAGIRAKILYRDLDVEQLGAVYERVLDYEPAAAGPTPLVRTRDVRKSSGSFYTPRAVATYLVRRTLEPLVRGRRADEILSLRVLDPAMGSGAFLVAACRFLAAAAEEALIEEGRWHEHDVTAADRVLLRREIASRCLFGVDLNPMAVQLARLSLWLATLASDKPLSFLDHHLVTGHSLVGATPEDMHRQPGGGRARHARERLSLFDETDLSIALAHAGRVLAKVATDPDDSSDIVRGKERAVQELQSAESPLSKWRAALDLWCAAWFWSDGEPPERAVYLDLTGRLLEKRATLPARIASTFLEESRKVAARHRFLHWPLAFPDVFSSTPEGRPSGFDAIIGNPPWDMVRGDSGEDDTKADRRRLAQQLTGFVRESGVYRVENRGHVNLYQLFVERALQLVRPGGRIGFVVPSGLVSDTGAAPLRRHLFHQADVDGVTGLDNRLGIFPVHRSVRFVLLTCTTGRETTAVPCRFGLTEPGELDAPASAPLVLTRRFLSRLSGEDDLGIPELVTETDLAIVERVSGSTPCLGAPDGWHVRFGRELNASDDRALFAPLGHGHGRPVIEGKQVDPFRVDLDASRIEVTPSSRIEARVPRRARLAYRDVASATNRLTLIAAIVPARAVTTHTLFCLRTPLALPAQHVLCALLNSYVANYLVRLRVNTHVTVSLVSRLRVPLVDHSHPSYGRLAACSAALALGSGPAEEMEEYGHIQAIAAHLYGLSRLQFEHVLSTFPLVPAEVRQSALRRFINFR